MPKIQISATLRPHVGGLAVIEVDGETVGALLQQLVWQFPELEARLFSRPGQIHSYVNLFIDGQSIRDLEQIDTPIGPQQTLLILTALSGG
jgi:molybdopterin converting factor small subunit